MRVAMKYEVPLWLRELLLGVALGAVVLVAIGVWVARNDQHRQICAIERYIEARFRIDAPLVSPAVRAERRAAIVRMEAEIGNNCNLKGEIR
jgi:hypothetical protein